MASPESLRLYFGNRLPPDVLDIIFQYGFHLWLAKPVEAWKVVERDYADTYRPSPWYRDTFRTIIWLVVEYSLSRAARRLVNYEDYVRRTRGDLSTNFFAGIARPGVWGPNRAPRYIRDGDEWYLVFGCRPSHWRASRFVEAPLPDDDDL